MAKILPPMHPGEVLREDFLVPMRLSPCALAKICDVPRTRIERIAREEISRDGRYCAAAFESPRYDGWILALRRLNTSPWSPAGKPGANAGRACRPSAP